MQRMTSMTKKTRFAGILLMIMLLSSILTACGSSADLTVFIMPREHLPDGVSEKVEEKLQKAFGEDKKMAVHGTPMYNDQKMIVELAAGGNGIMILPKEVLENMMAQGAAVQLDQWFKTEDYPEGVMESVVGDKDSEKKVTALFALPVEKIPVFKEAGYEEKDMFIFIPANAPDEELSVEVLKEIVKP
ncbi:hypothetical protein [Paenibacillus mendelii]|uniref:Lipoprotein n=1 Tax=Paenibacillus mendelii TaxID=206163 RepID=A0ABV6J8T8_9BACL|nr:hypothetical protein [Paenibacillus mendelii]MCQ6559639.1 hypothetical protein [Paenibacillus mendelii]